MRNGRVVFEMLNVSVLTEERGEGEHGTMTSLLVGIAISKRSRNRERERGERKVSLRGLGSLAFHA